VDMEDLTAFGCEWLQENCAGDISGDCRIGLDEFAVFAADWLNASFQ